MTALTRRGWAVCGVGVALALVGRLLGIPELYAMAVVALGLTAGAMIYVRVAPWNVEARREVRPPQVYAGANARVELLVRNVDNRRSPVLSARDPFDDGRRWARFHIAPLGPDETVRAAYRLPTADRGIFPLGPLQIGLTDPFGLAAQAREAAPAASLTVYPRVDTINPLPQARGADPNGSTGHPSLTSGGEDFYALRPYQTGDDLRRVHWASSARSDELMIRQDELPWQERMSVLADLRASVHTGGSLEPVLSAVASIVHSGWEARRQVRLVLTDGTDSGFGTGHVHLTTILGELAVARSEPSSHLLGGLAALNRGGTTGGLAVVTTDETSEQDLQLLRRLTGRFGTVVLVVFERSSWEPEAPARPTSGNRATRGPSRTVRVSAAHPFVTAWNQAVPLETGRSPARVLR